MKTPARALPVWGPAIRAGHWLLAAAVLACLWLHEGGRWHEAAGYLALALAGWRVLVGIVGRRPQLRLGGFVRGPSATLSYAVAVVNGREPRYIGHNPLGGWMVVALLGFALLAGASGALYTTDRFWGDAAVYRVHQTAGWAFAVLVPLHLLGVLLTSWLQRENLVAAMLTGRKRPAAPDDVGLG